MFTRNAANALRIILAGTLFFGFVSDCLSFSYICITQSHIIWVRQTMIPMKYLQTIILLLTICLILVGCGRQSEKQDSIDLVCSIMNEKLQDSVDMILEKRFQYEYGESMTFLFMVAQANEADTLLHLWLTNDLIEFPYDDHFMGALCYKDCEVVLDYVRPLSETPFFNESSFDSKRLDSLIQIRKTDPVAIEAQALYYNYHLSTQSGITLLESKEFNLSPLP